MELHVKARKRSGGQTKALRRDGFIPAVIFSKKISKGEGKTINVKIDLTEFNKVFAKAGESTLITLNLKGDTSHQILISDIQRDPITLNIIHASLFEVDMSEKITASIPINITSEDESEAVKSGEGLIIKVLDEIEVECLPNDLPQNFEVDVSGLKEVGETITVEQAIKVDPQKIQLNVNPDEIIIKVDYAEQLEVEEEEETTIEDVEVLSEKDGKEGEEGEEAVEGQKEPEKDKKEEDKTPKSK